MKKLINDPRNVVKEMLEGIVLTTPGTALLADESVVIRDDLGPADRRQVTILSGGGSGHEPAHAGYVGEGMLSAAATGDVFTSPSTDTVLAGIRAIAGPAGVLVIVKNYTGDRLNFGLAAELARAEGIDVEVVIVADDVALRDTIDRSRRRGIAGTVLVHKIAGAAAAAGRSLEDVARLAREAAEDLGSMGISLNACTLPAAGKPSFVLGAGEIEIGLGIHGEPGVKRVPIEPADALAELVLEKILEDGELRQGTRVALLVNGLGTTPPMELNIIMRAAIAYLDRCGIVVVRAWTGTFLSALDTPGFSLSVMKLDDERLALLDAATTASSWPKGGQLNLNLNAIAASPEIKKSGAADIAGKTSNLSEATIRDAILAAAQSLISAEAQLTELDSIAGDGDLGASMVRGAEAARNLPDESWATPAVAFAALGNALRRAIAGSSGPFYATALLRASRHLAQFEAPSPRDWADAFMLAVDAIMELGGAKPGDRTMLDALVPAASTFSDALGAGLSAQEAWAKAVAEAGAGAEATESMLPRAGRASYLGARAIGSPDGGAVSVVVWLKAITPYIG